jgi:hypothetical protein
MVSLAMSIMSYSRRLLMAVSLLVTVPDILTAQAEEPPDLAMYARIR